jgi:hypothetical protein
LPRFFHQNLFQRAATSQGIEIESKAFQRWLNVTFDRPGFFFSLSQIKNFLGNEGAAPKKCSLSLATFLKQKHVFGAQIGHFFLLFKA